MNTENDTAGLKATLNEENKNDMFRLPLLHHASDEVRFLLFFLFRNKIVLSFTGSCGCSMGSIDS